MKTQLDRHTYRILGTQTCFGRLLVEGYPPLARERGHHALFYHPMGFPRTSK